MEILISQAERLCHAGQLSRLLGSHVGRRDNDQGLQHLLGVSLFTFKDWESEKRKLLFDLLETIMTPLLPYFPGHLRVALFILIWRRLLRE